MAEYKENLESFQNSMSVDLLIGIILNFICEVATALYLDLENLLSLRGHLNVGHS